MTGLTAPKLCDFATFYRENINRVISAIRPQAGEAAEDVAHDAFAMAFQRWDEISEFDIPYAWVKLVASRMATRRTARDATRASLELLSQEPADHKSSEAQIDIASTLRRLPDRQILAFTVHHLHDRPVSEVADRLGCSLGAAKLLLHRSRRRVAERIGGYTGRWISETGWTIDAIVSHLRSTGSAKYVDVIVEEHLDGRGGRWELTLNEGTYLLSRNDGLRLDDGAFIPSRYGLVLQPTATTGTVAFRTSVDGNRLSAKMLHNTTAPTDGVPDVVWMNLFCESSQYEWVGVPMVPEVGRQPQSIPHNHAPVIAEN
jgi:RNA polymerase sigma-70 factor, ECF subfamily